MGLTLLLGAESPDARLVPMTNARGQSNAAFERGLLRLRLRPHDNGLPPGMLAASSVLQSERVTGQRLSGAGWRIILLASLGGTLEFYDFVSPGRAGAVLNDGLDTRSVGWRFGDGLGDCR